MTRILWLPDVLRDAGLTVRTVDGWQTRGSSEYDPRGIICHATAGSATSTDAGEIRVLLEGSTSAPAPIAQLYLSRTGAFHVVASGKCFHAKVGWGGPLEGLGNTHLIGIEAQNDNRGQSWPTVQVDAYERGVAAICKYKGWTPGRNVAAHREHQPGAKSDPVGIDMKAFRARVAAILAGEEDDMDQATFTKLLRGALTGTDQDSRDVQSILRALPLGYPVLPDMSLAVALGRILPKIEPAMAADAARDAELRALVEQYQSGGVTADAVVDALAARLQAGSPSA